MGFPVGMQLATVAFGIPLTVTGKEVLTTVTVKPTARVIWAATGQPLPEFADSFTAEAGQIGTFQVPYIDQGGFIDSAGAAFTDWAYQITAEWRFGNERPITWSKSFKPLVGQAGTIDLDLIPDGAVSIPVTAPTAAVLGFNGRTGFITLQESDLPARLSEAELSATYLDKTSGLSKADAAATYAPTAAQFGWVKPRDPVYPAGTAPTVEFLDPEFGSFPQFTNMLPHTTTSVIHTGGVYMAEDKFGVMYLDNKVNLPDPAPLESGHEYMASGTSSGLKVYVTNTTNKLRIIVDGQLVYSTPAPAAGMKAIRLTFPFAATRHIRFETQNILFGGLGYNSASAAVYAPTARKPRAAIYGDSWVGGAGGLVFIDLMGYLIANGLDWDVARMGQGGTGYVNDPAGAAVPYTDATRLANLAAQDLDYAVIFGTINDGAHSAAAVGAAATNVYNYMATNSPKTKLIVIGVQHLHTAPSSADIANNDAIKTAALAAPNVVKFLDQLNGEWITAADAALFIDSAHLGVSGHLQYAKRLIRELVKP